MYIGLIVLFAFVSILGNAWCNVHEKYPESWFYPIHWTLTGISVFAVFLVTEL